MAQINPAPPAKGYHIEHGVHVVFNAMARLAMIPHYYVFQRTTIQPITDIMNATTPDKTREYIVRWCRRKTNEAKYVQVAGAVMFASVVSCLTWEAVKDAHWSGPALWYASILFALASIFSAAQQGLVLPEPDTALEFNTQQVENFQQSLSSGRTEKPSSVTLFAWQSPIMLLGYSVASYVIGLCSVVVSPLVTNTTWGAPAKTVVLFFSVVAFIGISAAITTTTVQRLKVED